MRGGCQKWELGGPVCRLTPIFVAFPPLEIFYMHIFYQHKLEFQMYLFGPRCFSCPFTHTSTRAHGYTDTSHTDTDDLLLPACVPGTLRSVEEAASAAAAASSHSSCGC